MPTYEVSIETESINTTYEVFALTEVGAEGHAIRRFEAEHGEKDSFHEFSWKVERR
jgi:hypothetical protein